MASYTRDLQSRINVFVATKIKNALSKHRRDPGARQCALAAGIAATSTTYTRPADRQTVGLAFFPFHYWIYTESNKDRRKELQFKNLRKESLESQNMSMRGPIILGPRIIAHNFFYQRKSPTPFF